MSTLYFNNNLNEIKSIKNKSVRSTLLVPTKYLNKLNNFTKFGKFTIEDLINKFTILLEKKVILINPNMFKHTTLYQGNPSQKLNLMRCHFRSNPMVWHHWKRLANHFGVSMCYLFFICLKKVTSKDLESVGTPTDSRCLRNFIFFETTNFLRFYSHRWFFSRSYIKKQLKLKKN